MDQVSVGEKNNKQKANSAQKKTSVKSTELTGQPYCDLMLW